MKLVVETVAAPTSCRILSNLGIVRATKTMDRQTPVRTSDLDSVMPAHLPDQHAVAAAVLTWHPDDSNRLFENQVYRIDDDEHCGQDVEGHQNSY